MRKDMYYFTLALVCLILLVSAAIAEAVVINALPYEITTRGYYKINTNLNSSGHGIVVKANNVTIDLNGYTIEGSGTGPYNGIYMSGRNNVEIRNGTIRNFGSRGIYEGSTFGHSHRVINVRVIYNKEIGIYLNGIDNMVKDCTASNNGSNGIYIYHGSTVSGNTAYNNGGIGIAAGPGATISGNTVYNNIGTGISANSGSTVRNNTAFHNQKYGIDLLGYNLVDGNTAYLNNLSGGAANIKSCATCTFGVNVAP